VKVPVFLAPGIQAVDENRLKVICCLHVKGHQNYPGFYHCNKACRTIGHMNLDSMTNLLKNQNRIKLSAVAANKILVELGLLEEKERPSSKYPDKFKKYKALTERGLEFGINKENPATPDQTTPYYYVDRFDELLTLIINNVSSSSD